VVRIQDNNQHHLLLSADRNSFAYQIADKLNAVTSTISRLYRSSRKERKSILRPDYKYSLDSSTIRLPAELLNGRKNDVRSIHRSNLKNYAMGHTFIAICHVVKLVHFIPCFSVSAKQSTRSLYIWETGPQKMKDVKSIQKLEKLQKQVTGKT